MSFTSAVAAAHVSRLCAVSTSGTLVQRGIIAAIAIAANLWIIAAVGQEASPAKDGKKDTADEKTIRALVVELSDDSFDKREAAQKRLAALGEPALALIRTAAKESKDLEARERLGQLIRDITSSLFTEVRRFERGDKANNNWSTRLAVTPDGRRLVTATLGSLRCLNVDDGREALAFERADVKTCWAVSLAPDGQRLIVGTTDRVARVYDMKSGKIMTELKGPAAGAALLPDGKRAVTGGGERSLRLWDIESGRELRSFDSVPDDVQCLAASPDGKMIAAGHTVGYEVPGAIRLWDVESGKEVRTLNGHTKRLCSVRFSPDGKTLVSSSFDKTVRLWNVADGKQLKSLEGHRDRVEGAAFTPDGKRVISVGNQDNPVVVLWDVASGEMLLEASAKGGGLLDVVALPDGKRCLTCSKDGIVRLWEWKR